MRTLSIVASFLISSSAWADGVTNPEEMALTAKVGAEVSIATCSAGYLLTKAGNHAPSIRIFEKCAAAGSTQAMTWLAYMYQNGRAGAEDPQRAAYWDAQAAHAGDTTGMLNWGIDLLRGYGVGRYTVAGQYWINRAADAGVKSAIELRAAQYDLRVVTPDTDEHKFKPL